MHFYRVCSKLFMGMSCFLIDNAGMSQKSRVFPLTFHLFLFLEAGLGGFERLREALQALGGLF